MKCRSARFLRFQADVGISPYAVRRRLSQNFVGGDAHVAPPVGATAFTFQSVSGSGAEGETILNLGHVLPKIPLVDRQGSPETIRFLVRFWLLFPRGKSNPPEAIPADSIASPQLKHRNPISDRRRKPSRRAEDPGGGSSHAKTAKNSTRRAAGCRAPCALEGMERKIAN